MPLDKHNSSLSQNNADTSAQLLYRRLFHYVTPYWLVFVGAIIAMAIFAATETGLAAMMKPLLDGSFVERDPTTIQWLPIALIGLFIVRGLANFFTAYGLGWIARNVIKNLREEMFDRLVHLPASFYDGATTGQIMSQLLYDVEQVAEAATDAILTLIRDSLTILGLLLWMIYLNGILSLIILTTVPIIAYFVYRISHRFRRISKNIQDSMGDVGHICNEVIDGHREVKAFSSQMIEKQRFAIANQKNRRQRMKKIATEATAQPLIQFVAVIGLATVIYLATLPHWLDSISVGTFISFITAMFMILTPLKRLTKINSKLQAGIAAAQSIFNLIDQVPEQDKGNHHTTILQGDVKYQSVHFKYPTAHHSLLKDISFHVRPGETIAFVGHSGSGKTSLVNLLTRLYPLQSGEIMIDDIDIQQLPLGILRKHVAIVGQHVTLFNDTIANNIAYGQNNISEQHIIEAAKAAHAWSFIQTLPKGLATQIGENGILLSGGQRQRLAIARALLSQAPILILDEATASLDSQSEHHIQIALDNLKRNRTTLVIAHRLSTIEQADHILVIHEGRIVESGCHQQLLQLQGHYAQLHQLQFENTQ